MKKIGILTFHYADNYGAVLQAYALRKILNSFSGYKAEIINYVPVGYEYKVYLENNLLDLYVEKRKKFESFLSKKCMVDSPMIHTLKGIKYDYYCVGSDQVWNTELSIARNQAYFLGDLEDKAIRFSYAASIGMRFDKIDKNLFRKYVSKFSFVGIREQSYIKIISEICGVKCVHNIDPTLLLLKEDYDELIDSCEKNEERQRNLPPYLLYIWYGEESHRSIELVNTIARKYGLIILHNFMSKRVLARKMLCKDGGYIFHKGIEEFLWYVKHASFVVTDSYHVGIFSIIFHRPLYSYIFKEGERQEDLAKLLKIEDRIVKGYVRPKDLNENMNYDLIDAAIERERKNSLKYLQNILL